VGQDQLDPGITRATASTPPEWQANAVGIFPLSFMQESLWFIDQVAPGISAYNLAEARRLRGRLDIPALQKSLDLLVRRHESLRTVFRQDQAGPVQVVLSPSSFPLPIKDLSLQHLNSSELQGLLKAEAARPFELKRRPLARGLLLRLGPEDHVLLINLHHIICDQHSLNLFFAELAEH